MKNAVNPHTAGLRMPTDLHAARMQIAMSLGFHIIFACLCSPVLIFPRS